MNPDIISAIFGVTSFICSVGASAFIAGARWGSIEARMNGIEKDVAEIKGMFRLTLRKDIDDG